MGCAAANASLDLFETEPRLPQSANIERMLNDGLQRCDGLPGIREVRCKGAIGVVQLDRAPDLDALRRQRSSKRVCGCDRLAMSFILCRPW